MASWRSHAQPTLCLYLPIAGFEAALDLVVAEIVGLDSSDLMQAPRWLVAVVLVEQQSYQLAAERMRVRCC